MHAETSVCHPNKSSGPEFFTGAAQVQRFPVRIPAHLGTTLGVMTAGEVDEVAAREQAQLQRITAVWEIKITQKDN